MGAPKWFAYERHVAMGLSHLNKMIEILTWFPFEEVRGDSLVAKEPIGVAALITPWNWPLNQVTCKVAPAIAAGCAMILKPAEQSPLSAIIFTEIMDAAGTPPGVFNLVNGDGATVGSALSRHPGVDMVSFTGSTRAGVLVAKPLPTRSSVSIRSWAANLPIYCCPMSTSKTLSKKASRAAS